MLDAVVSVVPFLPAALSVAVAGWVLYIIYGYLPLRPSATELFEPVDVFFALAHLVVAHLVAWWAIGPLVAGLIVGAGVVSATAPWQLLRSDPTPAATPAPEPVTTSAGASPAAASDDASEPPRPEMTADEQAAWDDLMRQLEDNE